MFVHHAPIYDSPNCKLSICKSVHAKLKVYLNVATCQRLCRGLALQCFSFRTMFFFRFKVYTGTARMRREGYSSCLVCVCLSAHAILAVRAFKKYNERYHRQIYGNIKMAFFLKLSYSKVRASFTYLGRGGHL